MYEDEEYGRVGQVGSQLEQQGLLIEQLGKVTNLLQGRLETVVSPRNDGADPNGSRPEESLVPLAEGLRRNNGRLGSMIDALESLSAGIEL